MLANRLFREVSKKGESGSRPRANCGLGEPRERARARAAAPLGETDPPAEPDPGAGMVVSRNRAGTTMPPAMPMLPPILPEKLPSSPGSPTRFARYGELVRMAESDAAAVAS